MLRTTYADRVAERGEAARPGRAAGRRAVASTSGPKRRCSPRPRWPSSSAPATRRSCARRRRSGTAASPSCAGRSPRTATIRRCGERLRRTLEQAPGDELFTAAIHNHFVALESLSRNVSPEAFRARRRDPRGERPSGLARRRSVRPSRRVRTAHHAADREAELRARAHRDVVRRRAPDARHRTTRSSSSPTAGSSRTFVCSSTTPQSSMCPSSSSPTHSTRRLEGAVSDDAAMRSRRARTLREPRRPPSWSSKRSCSRSRRPSKRHRNRVWRAQRTPRRAVGPPHRRRHPLAPSTIGRIRRRVRGCAPRTRSRGR